MSQVSYCGFDSFSTSDCRAVNSGELFIAIAPFTFFPFMIVWIWSMYKCFKECRPDDDLSCSCSCFNACCRSCTRGRGSSRAAAPPPMLPQIAGQNQTFAYGQGPGGAAAIYSPPPHNSPLGAASPDHTAGARGGRSGVAARAAAAAQARMAASGALKCSVCAYSNAAGATACTMCGGSLGAVPASYPPAPPAYEPAAVVAEGGIACPTCTFINAAGSTTCSTCTAPLV